MIIFNTKAKDSNFMLRGKDRRLFDIHSTVELETLYEHLLAGTEEGEMEVEQFNTAETPSVFIGTFSDTGTNTTWRSRSLYRGQSDAITYDNLKDVRQAYLSHQPAEDMARMYFGFAADNNSARVFGNFEQRDVVREELIRHIADALCIPPELALDTEMPAKDKIALGRDMNRLRWFFAEDPLDEAKMAGTPPIEHVKAYQSWSAAEKRLVTNAVRAPQELLAQACAFKAQFPNKILTPDVLNNKAFQVTITADFERQAKEAFEASSFRRAPRVLNEYLRAQVAAGVGESEIDNIIAEFNLKSLGAVAPLGSEVLYALVPHIDFSKVKADQIEFLATHITESQLRKLVTRGFGEWYDKHRGDRTEDLAELLSTLSVRQLGDTVWDPNKSAREILTATTMGKFIEEARSFESTYHYRFSDNCIAIRGKEICVTYGPLKMYMLSADDYRNFAVGDWTQCCQHWGGAGETCCWKYTSDPFAACVVIEKNGKVVGQAFVFTDEIKDTFVFDNMEFANDGDVANFKNIISTYVEALPYSNVHLGAGYTVAELLSMGKSIPQAKATMAGMPTTTGSLKEQQQGVYNNRNYAARSIDTHPENYPARCDVYSDYHPNARVFKKDGAMYLTKGTGVVTYGEVEPTPWDALRDSPAKFVLNDYDLPAAERQAMASMNLDEERFIAQSARFRAYFLSDPSIARGLPAVPEEWQRALLEQRVNPRSLGDIKNPIPEVRDLIIEWDPERVVDWEDATPAQWEAAIRQKPALISQFPGEVTQELAMAAFHAGGVDALAYIPARLIPTEELSGIIAMSPRTILSFEDPAEELVQIAVSREPYLIGSLPVVSDTVGATACHVLPSAVLLWPEAPSDIIQGCIEREPFLIRNYAHTYPEFREVAIRSNPDAIASIPGATDEEKALALRLKANPDPIGVNMSDTALIQCFAGFLETGYTDIERLW